MQYIAYLHKEKKSDFGVSFPDFPGCVTAGKSLEEARRLAAEALRMHLEGLMKDGETIPEPSTLDQLAEDSALTNAVAFLVEIDPKDKVERFNITARRSQMDKIDRLAKKRGMTRSAYIVAKALEIDGNKSA
jgi:predicted RNase H-like HicB family nuclease